ncbi:MAG TPA: hypothetical protein VE442_24570 [Jatrophihabitans sp.]|jgi:hypothetical protein|nr:hypothetical protein [Jatrophihabitans sp.]
MTTAPAFDLDPTARCFVLVDTSPPTGWALLPQRRRDRWLAHLRHRSLDARLAAGESPESARLLAVRTAHLVGRASRRRIATRWDALAITARRHRLQHELADHIQQVADLLRTDQPVGVHGVALATTTLALAADAVRRLERGGGDIVAATARSTLSAM